MIVNKVTTTLNDVEVTFYIANPDAGKVLYDGANFKTLEICQRAYPSTDVWKEITEAEADILIDAYNNPPEPEGEPIV